MVPSGEVAAYDLLRRPSRPPQGPPEDTRPTVPPAGQKLWHSILRGQAARFSSPVCGRFTQDLSEDQLLDLYEMDAAAEGVDVRARWNGAPTQEFVVCRSGPGGGNHLALHRWGLVPPWARDTKIGPRLINARSETVHAKPSFRVPFRRRRCLVPATGWFEWQQTGGPKQPWWISLGGRPFSFAGLWETWDRGQGPLRTFTILTCPAVPELRGIHARQPVIVPWDRYGEWLDPTSSGQDLLALARTMFVGPFDLRKVSRTVNRVSNDSPAVLRPLDRIADSGAAPGDGPQGELFGTGAG